MDWIRGKKIRLKKMPLGDEDRFRYLSSRYIGDRNGYNEHDIEIRTTNDGAMIFSNADGDGIVYFYPEQVCHIRKILEMAV